MGVVALGRSFFFLFLSFWFLYLIIPLFPGILFPPPFPGYWKCFWLVGYVKNCMHFHVWTKSCRFSPIDRVVQISANGPIRIIMEALSLELPCKPISLYHPPHTPPKILGPMLLTSTARDPQP